MSIRRISIEELQHQLLVQASKPDSSVYFLVELAFLACHEESLMDVLRLIAKDETGVRECFWRNVNHTPSTDEGWQDFHYLVSTNSEQYKQERRMKIELIRSTMALEHLKIIELFSKYR